MSNKTMRDAINEALRQEMQRDPTVIIIGEDVVGGRGGSSGAEEAGGGAFGVHAGLIQEWAGTGDRHAHYGIRHHGCGGRRGAHRIAAGC